MKWNDDPMILKILRNEKTEIIFSNVLVDEKKKPHWVGSGEEPPQKGYNFQGQREEGKTDKNGKPVPLSHPNARFTVQATALENYSNKMEDKAGVVTKVFTYSGRDSDTMPPVWVAKDPDYGVVIGASIVSAATATEIGATGVKRQPWANQPFIPGGLGDYMQEQFHFFNSNKIKHEYRPIMAVLNSSSPKEHAAVKGTSCLAKKKKSVCG